MKPSQRFRLARLASALTRPRCWIDPDPPTWDWPVPAKPLTSTDR